MKNLWKSAVPHNRTNPQTRNSGKHTQISFMFMSSLCFFQLYREVRIMKVLNHPNIGKLNRWCWKHIKPILVFLSELPAVSWRQETWDKDWLDVLATKKKKKKIAGPQRSAWCFGHKNIITNRRGKCFWCSFDPSRIAHFWVESTPTLTACFRKFRFSFWGCWAFLSVFLIATKWYQSSTFYTIGFHSSRKNLLL